MDVGWSSDIESRGGGKLVSPLSPRGAEDGNGDVPCPSWPHPDARSANAPTIPLFSDPTPTVGSSIRWNIPREITPRPKHRRKAKSARSERFGRAKIVRPSIIAYLRAGIRDQTAYFLPAKIRQRLSKDQHVSASTLDRSHPPYPSAAP